MLGPEPAWPLGQGHAQKKGKIRDSCSALDTGNHLDPAQEGTSRSTAPAPRGVFPIPLGIVSCSFWGQLEDNPSVFYPNQPHATLLTWPRARHSTSADTEAPRLKCYKTQCQSPRDHCPALLLSFSPLPKALCAACPALLIFPEGILGSSLAMQHPLKKGTRHLGCFSFLK